VISLADAVKFVVDADAAIRKKTGNADIEATSLTPI